jgi:hypothetical protein
MRPEDVAWSYKTFMMLADGGMWMVPRSGLLFQKKGNELHLVHRMPYLPEMAEAYENGADVPPTPEALLEYQQRDFECIARHFREAGIEVIDKTKKGQTK